MKFKIKIDYTTGDSNGSHRETDYVDVTCETEAIALENLKRLKAHYVFYHAEEKARTQKEKQKIIDDHRQFPWFVDGKYPGYLVRLIASEGKTLDYHPPYYGYFERLNELGIVIAEDASDWVWKP